MFQFRRFPTYDYLIQHGLTGYCPAGFPHSEIHGSQAAFASPWLIVDRYVLRRLLVPRHSPYALSSLTMFDRINPSFESLGSFFGFFPSTIIYCSCYPKIFYHFTFTCALFSFQGTLTVVSRQSSDFQLQLRAVRVISCWFSFSHSPRYASACARMKNGKQPKFGGLKWTRTTDLTLIRRAL